MKVKEIVRYIDGLFSTSTSENYKKETGIIYDAANTIRRVGYATNLTLEVIELAKKNNVDLIITHHDAWDFIYGLRDACIEKLKAYQISHYYNHLPLDDCDFGTNNSLLEKLGATLIEKTHEEDGFLCGRIAEFNQPISFNCLVKRLENLLDEPVQAWQFNDKKIERIGLVCGGGGFSSDVKVAVDKKCDVYITGEKILYTIEYAQFTKLNLIIGSHTFTEIFGVESLVEKLKDKYKQIEIVRLNETHLETRKNI